MTLIGYCACFIIRLLLRLRYRITVQGLAQVRRKGARGVLFLPNHPALIDPLIITTLLFPLFQVRPLAFEEQISRPVLGWLCRCIGTIAMPDMLHAGKRFKEIVGLAFAAIIDALQKGQNVVIYPAGRIYRSRFENLRNTRAVSAILQACPDAHIVLVRTTGLWGSSFGWASGRAPDMDAALKKAFRALPVNGIFFSPRRPVRIEFVEPDDFPRSADRRTINRYLEAFYNAGAPPNTYVPYTWWEPGGARELPDPALQDK